LVATKRRIFACYRELLSDLPLTMNPEPANTTNAYWMPTIVVDADVRFDRERLLAAFNADNIDGRVFFWPLSSLPPFSACPTHVVSLALSARALNLPSYHDLSRADMERVAAHVVVALGPPR
jgi:perosamine synthetase